MDNIVLSAGTVVSPFFLVASGLFLLFVGKIIRPLKGTEGYAAFLAALIALLFLHTPSAPVVFLGGNAIISGYTVWIWRIILLSLAGTSFISISFNLQHSGIYYFLLFISAAGSMFTAASDNLFFALISAEISIVPLYFLVSCRKGRQGLFAAYRLSVSGLFLTAACLLSIAFLNYSCPSLSLTALSEMGLPDGIALLGFLLFSAAFSLKMLALPFNLVFKDVFTDSPAAISAFMASVWSVSAFPVLYKIYSLFYSGPVHNFFPVLALITSAFGAYQAFYGKNIRRISFGCMCFGTGFSLLSFVGEISGEIALLYHLPAFSAASAALFIFSFYFEKEELSLPLSSLAGFSEKHPVIASAAAASLFSAAGLPPFAGFFAKSIILFSLLKNGYFLIAVSGAVFMFFACCCSIRIVSAIFFQDKSLHEPDVQEKTRDVPLSAAFVLILLALFLAFYGIFASYFLAKIAALPH